MRGDIGKGTEEWTFQSLYWDFRKAYYIAEPTNDEYWQNLITDADILVDKFKDTDIAKYVKDVVFACVMDIDRRGKGK